METAIIHIREKGKKVFWIKQDRTNHNIVSISLIGLRALHFLDSSTQFSPLFSRMQVEHASVEGTL